MDRQSFYIALKLVALAQSNHELKLENLKIDVQAPKLGELNSNMVSLVSQNDPWYIKASSKLTFDKSFDSLSPINNQLSGTRIKPMLLSTGLPIDVLGRIWSLSDLDVDGQLDRAEFHIAMQLVAKAKEGLTIPDQLPPSLLPYKKGRLTSFAAPNMATPYVDTKIWVVTFEEKSKSDVIFNQLDTDNDGYVNGSECKDVFLKTGLQALTLASIWNICDTNSSGRLNAEQFALAMHFVNKKINTGLEPPLELSPEMIPPSMRPKVLSNEAVYTNKELEELQNQVTELQREKLYYEQRASEHDIQTRQKRTELSNLELELDSLFKTLRDREYNRSEDQKRLNDFNDKFTRLNTQFSEIKRKFDSERVEVENLKFQINNTESAHLNKEQELNKIRNDIQSIRKEKFDFDGKLNMRRSVLKDLQQTFSQIESDIHLNKENVNILKQIQDLSNKLLKEYNLVLNEGAFGHQDLINQLENELIKLQNSLNTTKKLSHKTSFSSTSSFFTPQNQFSDNISNKIEPQFDPFGSFSDPFGSSNQQQSSKTQFDDTFFTNDPFAFSNTETTSRVESFSARNDPFASFKTEDPFAVFDNDKKKNPPPRPAPPRPITPSLKPTGKANDLSKRPQSAMDFTYNTKLNIFPDLDPFGSANTNDNWAAFGTSQSTANNKQQNIIDPFF